MDSHSIRTADVFTPMEHFELRKSGDSLEVYGLPADAMKVVEIRGEKAQRLADLALHRADLTFAKECLAAMTEAPDEPAAIKEALWRSAIVHFGKCFGSDARFQLSAARFTVASRPTHGTRVASSCCFGTST
jgi:hypothetical protein